MKIENLTTEDFRRVAQEGVDYPEPAVPADTARNLSHMIRQTTLAVPLNRYFAASDVIGAVAFGILLGLAMAREGE